MGNRVNTSALALKKKKSIIYLLIFDYVLSDLCAQSINYFREQ